MARITIEDCLKAGYNKFTIVHLAARRVIQFKKGKEPLITTSNKDIVTALREIGAGKVAMKIDDDLAIDEPIDEPESPDEDVTEITDDVDATEATQEE